MVCLGHIIPCIKLISIRITRMQKGGTLERTSSNVEVRELHKIAGSPREDSSFIHIFTDLF